MRALTGKNLLLSTLGAGALLVLAQPTLAQGFQCEGYKVKINQTPPKDGCLGAFEIGVPNAARFAWDAFIALNWPAKSTGREQPDTSANFGADNKPLVWETMRAKVELYPGNGSATTAPHGATLNNKGQPNNGPNFGYDDPPDYIYGPANVGTSDGRIVPCSGQAVPTTPSWIPLDETTEIGVARVLASQLPTVDPTGNNSQPQLIRYAVKSNRSVYTNVVSNQFWYGVATNGAPLANAQINMAATQPPAVKPPSGVDPATPFVNFNPSPTGQPNSIEVKSAWRPLTASEAASGRFHTTNVRYFENNPKSPGTLGLCYREAVWGLVGMHVIQKTPSAPWFVWATFEQADNLLNQSGQPTEDVDGNIIDPSVSALAPTSPQLRSNPAQPNPSVDITPAGSPYCTSPSNRLYFQENPLLEKLPSGGNICMNRRYYAIPSEIITVNAEAHAVIQDYLTTTKQKSSPWMYYKLINVQPVPFDKSAVDPTNTSSTAISTYHLSNAVIESDYTLGNFDGNLANGGAPTEQNADGSAYFNTTFDPFQGANLVPPPKNMGGCSGCHGFAAQVGTDFSFALLNNSVLSPDQPNPFVLRGVHATVNNNSSEIIKRLKTMLGEKAPAKP